MKHLLIVVGAAFTSCALGGAEISQHQAELAARAWAVRGSTMGAQMGVEVSSSAVHETSTGAKFYTVKTKGGGTVFLPADDEIEPILCFTGEETDFSTIDPKSPLWAFLDRHVSDENRILSDRAGLKFAAAGGAAESSRKAKWTSLLAEGEKLEHQGNLKYAGTRLNDADLSDIRVPALLKTKWSQTGKGYNYYTPNGYPCGCVATAQGQVMRHFRWPLTSVYPSTRTCSVDGQNVSLKMKGGVYNWDLMPERGGSTDEEKDMVGRLLYDVGVTLHMSYASAGSGANTVKVRDSLLDYFGYGGAIYVYDGSKAFSSSSASRSANLRRVFFANFDAGCPVVVGIPGHEIVADGYGFLDETEYVHFNFGWSGASDFWYYIPDLTGAGKSYSYIDDLVYNIFIEDKQTSAIVSGRVIDPSGRPVVGATVRAHDAGETAVLKETTTDARGIWAIIVKAGSVGYGTYGDYLVPKTRTIDISVGPIGNCAAATRTGITVSCPSGMTVDSDAALQTASFGNSWGNDIQVDYINADYPVVANTGATFEQHAVGETRIFKLDDAGELANESFRGEFWYGMNAEGAVVARADGGHAASFTGIVYRAIHNTYDVTNAVLASVADFPSETLARDLPDFSFETDVWLPATEEAPALPDDQLKIALYAKAAVGTTNLVIIAGRRTSAGVETVEYETEVVVDTTGVHHFAARALANKDGTMDFAVTWDGRRVRAMKDGVLIRTFPSRIGPSSPEAATVRALGYVGLGIEADNVFTRRANSRLTDATTIIIR